MQWRLQPCVRQLTIARGLAGTVSARHQSLELSLEHSAACDHKHNARPLDASPLPTLPALLGCSGGGRHSHSLRSPLHRVVSGGAIAAVHAPVEDCQKQHPALLLHGVCPALCTWTCEAEMTPASVLSAYLTNWWLELREQSAEVRPDSRLLCPPQPLTPPSSGTSAAAARRAPRPGSARHSPAARGAALESPVVRSQRGDGTFRLQGTVSKWFDTRWHHCTHASPSGANAAAALPQRLCRHAQPRAAAQRPPFRTPLAARAGARLCARCHRVRPDQVRCCSLLRVRRGLR